MTYMPKIDRRSFLVSTAGAAGGLALGFNLPIDAAEAADAGAEVNAWVVVKPDETVVIRIARSEMGQGTLTGLAQLVAEELECDWSKVTYEFPTPGENVARKRVWGDFFTAGSQGIRASNKFVREGGAAARMMLISAAATELNVPATELTAANGVITHAGSGRKVTYGKVAAAAGKLDPPKDPKLKDPKDWKVIGQGKKRLDTPLKVTGEAKYGIDVRLPGMLYAAIKACPVNGGTVKSFDAGFKVASVGGVKKIVQVENNAVAVIADSWWRAKTTLDALPIEWNLGDNAKVSSASIAAWLKEGLDADTGLVGNKTGDAKAALASAAKKVEAVYSYPYQHHVTMEPQNATARFTDDKCEVWTSTQNGEAALALVSETSGLPIAKCEVYKTFLGGGFGRRSTSHDYVKQAVLIAKQMPGVPIKLLWSREEDMIHGWYHPVTQAKLTAGFDADKNLTAMHIRISGQSILATVMPARMQEGRDPATFSGLYPGGAEAAFGYDIPNVLVDHSMRNPHINPGFWRGVNINHNAIYLECFMDELAKEAGMDPLEFRRKIMAKHPKHLHVLNVAAEKIGWGTPAPAGVHRGIAQHMGFGSYIAAAAEVSVTGNKVKVHRIVGVTDPGYAVNPAQIERQIAGSFVYGLTGLFLGGNTVKDGRIEQENFDTYDMMRLAQMPKVEAYVVPSQDGVWGGVGEPTICVAPPAVLNAIAAATGTRYRSVPLRDHGLTMV
jgi:isoquinoline 1-oxidoreductase beta subunit